MSSVEARLVPIIRAHLRGNVPEVVAPDMPLVNLGLDSLGAIDLLFNIEEQFEITFPDEMLNQSTFRTQRTLQLAIENLLPGGGSAPDAAVR